jgi:hypothetical protein
MKKLAAEFVGTFALVFAGTGAIIINDLTHGAISHLGVSVTFGLIVLDEPCAITRAGTDFRSSRKYLDLFGGAAHRRRSGSSFMPLCTNRRVLYARTE